MKQSKLDSKLTMAGSQKKKVDPKKEQEINQQ